MTANRLDGHGDLEIKGMVLVAFHAEGILGEGIEIRNTFIHLELGRIIALQFQHGLHCGNMPVINMAVRNDILNQIAIGMSKLKGWNL